jgi:phytoene synthase
VTEDARLAAAYASCARDARSHYENFPVGSLLLPRGMRNHVVAVYAFARAADDFADEGARSVEERLNLLDGWSRRLERAASGGAQDPSRRGEPAHAPAIFVALGASIRACGLPVALLDDLLSAFRQDVTVTRYATWTEVLDYCRRSANPVGRLLLRMAWRRDAKLDAWSDALCTALQLTNFWQDVKVDYDRGRVYMPLEEQQAHGATDEALARGTITPAWQAALSSAAARTWHLFDEGKPLCDVVGGRLRYELRATWLGGTRILDRLSQVQFDVVNRRPTLRASDVPSLAWQLLTWTSTPVPLGYRSRSS